MTNKVFIFDGYNLIYANEQLQRLLIQDMAVARMELQEQITNYLGFQNNSRGILVFDGPNENYTQEKLSDNLEIYYGKTADTIIEKIAKDFSGSTELTLVSSDRLIYNSILPTKGIVKQIKSKEFWQQKQGQLNNFQTEKYPKNTIADRLDETTKKEINKLRET